MLQRNSADLKKNEGGQGPSKYISHPAMTDVTTRSTR